MSGNNTPWKPSTNYGPLRFDRGRRYFLFSIYFFLCKIDNLFVISLLIPLPSERILFICCSVDDFLPSSSLLSLHHTLGWVIRCCHVAAGCVRCPKALNASYRMLRTHTRQFLTEAVGLLTHPYKLSLFFSLFLSCMYISILCKTSCASVCACPVVIEVTNGS